MAGTKKRGSSQQPPPRRGSTTSRPRASRRTWPQYPRHRWSGQGRRRGRSDASRDLLVGACAPPTTDRLPVLCGSDASRDSGTCRGSRPSHSRIHPGILQGTSRDPQRASARRRGSQTKRVSGSDFGSPAARAPAMVRMSGLAPLPQSIPSGLAPIPQITPSGLAPLPQQTPHCTPACRLHKPYHAGIRKLNASHMISVSGTPTRRKSANR